jgi:cell wall-associated NlpC family hydrolase
MDKFWMQKYLRIPYKTRGHDFTGCDCGGLLRLVYKEELNIDLPDWEERYISTHRESFSALDTIFDEQTSTIGDFPMQVPLDEVQPFDALVFRMGKFNVHTGVVIRKGKFLHVQEGGNTTVEDYTGLRWKNRLVGVYRHVSRI